MAEANGEAAAPETARQPCGIVGCCRAEPSGYTPTAAPKVRLTEEQRAEYSSAALEEFDSGCRERDCVTCWEEVGHTILAAINHATINFVQACVTSTSHLSYSCRNSEDVDLPILIGGRVARGMAEQRILAPSAGEMTTYLQKARSDSDGSCDWCQCARKLLKYNPDADDAALVERWRDHWRHVVELLDTAVARATLDHLASALQERHHLTGDEVREIIGDAWDTVVWAFVFNKHCKQADAGSIFLTASIVAALAPWRWRQTAARSFSSWANARPPFSATARLQSGWRPFGAADRECVLVHLRSAAPPIVSQRPYREALATSPRCAPTCCGFFFQRTRQHEQQPNGRPVRPAIARVGTQISALAARSRTSPTKAREAAHGRACTTDAARAGAAARPQHNLAAHEPTRRLAAMAAIRRRTSCRATRTSPPDRPAPWHHPCGRQFEPLAMTDTQLRELVVAAANASREIWQHVRKLTDKELADEAQSPSRDYQRSSEGWAKRRARLAEKHKGKTNGQ